MCGRWPEGGGHEKEGCTDTDLGSSGCGPAMAKSQWWMSGPVVCVAAVAAAVLQRLSYSKATVARESTTMVGSEKVVAVKRWSIGGG
jgi:hypothetical protein